MAESPTPPAPSALAGDPPLEAMTLAGVMEDLDHRGFTEHFKVVGARLRGIEGGGVFPADQVSISEYHRFEGISDPDDLAILYAIEARSGIRGTLVDAFGVYSDPCVGDFMEDVPRPAIIVHG